MHIDSILKKENGKYIIKIDGESITTFEDVILDYKLLFKKTITKEEYNNIIEKTKYYDSYNKVFKYVLKSKKSLKEVSDYIDKLEIKKSDKNDIINKLKKINLINDREYCKAYINDKILLNKWGINKIRGELIKNNIDDNLIDECLKNIDKNILIDNLEKIILKKINSNHKYSINYLKQKLINDLVNDGYNKEDIISIFTKNIKEDSSIIEKEYNKLLNKYKNKYDSYKLESFIKNKLLSKGFTYDEINNIKKTEE